MAKRIFKIVQIIAGIRRNIVPLSNPTVFAYGFVAVDFVNFRTPGGDKKGGLLREAFYIPMLIWIGIPSCKNIDEVVLTASNTCVNSNEWIRCNVFLIDDCFG